MKSLSKNRTVSEMNSMRICTVMVCFFFICQGAFAQKLGHVISPEAFIDSGIVGVSPGGTLLFNDDHAVGAAEFLHQFSVHLGLTENDELRALGSETAEDGLTRDRFQQFHRGVPVDSADILIFSRDGKLKKARGSVAAGLDIDPALAMHEELALQLALEHVGAATYIWEVQGAGEEAYPSGELRIVRLPGEPEEWAWTPCWVFEIAAAKPSSYQRVFVDAFSGEIVKSPTLEHATPATGIAVTLFNGVRPIGTAERGRPKNDFILKDMDRNIHTKHFSSIAMYGGWFAANNVISDNNIWSGNAASAHWVTRVAHNYYLDRHGRNGLDGNGGEVRVLSRTDMPNNAFYKFVLGNDYLVFGAGAAALDIGGHEFTHGVIRHTSGLDNESLPGALNESFADIFGVMVERRITGTHDWDIGEDLSSGRIRDMDNPNALNHPDTLGGNFFVDTTNCSPSDNNDNCGVHTNSGVQNRWFSLLVDGDTLNNVTVNGIAITDAARIAFRNMTMHLPSNADFTDAREGSVDAAIDLFGQCSDEVKEVTNAWAAVGVGNPYSPCVPMSVNMSVKITSQQIVGTHYFTANVVNAQGGVTFHWLITDIGHFPSSNSSVAVDFPTSGLKQVTVVATDSTGAMAVDTHTVLVN
ncbi:MAG: M4 family metallopeptidase [Acidobacteriota bacterium]|nr:M4 family metallopeptidase [Acidobacteriota bacterium]